MSMVLSGKAVAQTILLARVEQKRFPLGHTHANDNYKGSTHQRGYGIEFDLSFSTPEVRAVSRRVPVLVDKRCALCVVGQ